MRTYELFRKNTFFHGKINFYYKKGFQKYFLFEEIIKNEGFINWDLIFSSND
jgi:hypothetical protein